MFGAEGMNAFFKCLFSPEHTIIAESEDEKPAAMGYLVPMGELIGGSAELLCANALPCVNALRCVMIYSIATLPEHRGRGLGAAVVNKLISTAFESGFSVAVLSPSTDSLFEYYSKHTAMRDWFYAGETGISATSTWTDCGISTATASEVKSALPVIEVSTAQYGCLRETLLGETAHIKYNASCLEYQKMLCKELGGGFFQVGSSCAVVEVQANGAVCVKEMLVSRDDDERDVIAAINAAFPSNTYAYRFPTENGNGRRFGMLAACDEVTIDLCDFGTAPWYGLAFD